MSRGITIPPYRPTGDRAGPVPGGGYIEVDAGAGDFGPAPLARLGLGAAQGVAGAVGVLAQQLAGDNEAAVKGADVRLGEAEQALLFDGEAGYLNTQGRDALERAPSVLEAFGAAQAQLAATLGDQDQRRMFETLSASRQADFTAQVTRHGDAERQRWHDAASERRIAQARVEAGRYWNDDGLLRRALLTARAELGDQARRHGWADGEAAARLRQEAGRMLAAAIEAAADRDPGRAQALYARDGRMLDAPSRAAIDTLLAEMRTRERAAAQSAALLREVPAPQARIARAAAIAEPALRTATLGLLRSADATAEARARALGEQVLALVLAEGLTDPSQVPVRDWAMLDAVRRAAIAARLDHNARGEEPPPDPALADALVRQMTREPQAFARRDLVPFVGLLPLDRWQRLRAWQAGLRRDDRDTVEQVYAIRRGLRLGERLLSHAISSNTGESKDSNPKRWKLSLSDYRWALVEEIDTYRRINGIVPDEAAMFDMADSLAIELIQSGGRPALEGDPYSPRSVEDRVRPLYEPNPAHGERLRPGKTIEPRDARTMYHERGVRVDSKTWIARAPNGLYYMYQTNNAGRVHFQGYATVYQLRQWRMDVDRIHRMGPLGGPFRGGGETHDLQVKTL